jgi:hypothetical protein
MTADYDQWPAFRFLAQEVADQLGRRRGEPWTVATVHEDSAHPAVTLAGPGHARVRMQHGFHAARKVTVQGEWPNGTTHGAGSRNIDPGRGARAIATAADTYVLRGGYLDALPGVVAKWEAAVARRTARAEIMDRFAGLFQLDPPGDAKLSLSPLLPMRGEVSLSWNHDEPPQVSLELHGLDVATAEVMLTAMAASPGVQGRCCTEFGPGHDQRLARLGCRRAARAGEPSYAEAEALYGLYGKAGAIQSWQDWLGGAAVHPAWR